MANDLLERYVRGECEAVWAGLTALGNLDHDEEMRIVADTIARETMRRVRLNIQTLAERLARLGFRFGEGEYDDEDEETRRRLLADEPMYSFSDEQTTVFGDEIAPRETHRWVANCAACFLR